MSKSHSREALRFIHKILSLLKCINNDDLFKAFCKLLKFTFFYKKAFDKWSLNE